jgi:hypothetical protein
MLSHFPDNVREELKIIAPTFASQKMWKEFGIWLNTTNAECTERVLRQYGRLLYDIAATKAENYELKDCLWNKFYDKYHDADNDIDRANIFGLIQVFFETENAKNYAFKLSRAIGSTDAENKNPILDDLLTETIKKALHALGFEGTQSGQFGAYLHAACENRFKDFLAQIKRLDNNETAIFSSVSSTGRSESFRRERQNRRWVEQPVSMSEPNQNTGIPIGDMIPGANNIVQWIEKTEKGIVTKENHELIAKFKAKLSPGQLSVYNCCLEYIKQNEPASGWEDKNPLGTEAREIIMERLGMNSALFRQNLQRIIKVIRKEAPELVKNLNIDFRPRAGRE